MRVDENNREVKEFPHRSLLICRGCRQLIQHPCLGVNPTKWSCNMAEIKPQWRNSWKYKEVPPHCPRLMEYIVLNQSLPMEKDKDGTDSITQEKDT